MFPNKTILNLLIPALLFCSCQKPKVDPQPLQHVLQSENPLIKKVMANPEAYELQVIFSRIHRLKDSIGFTDYSYRLSDSSYFYPASTVKFPIAVLTLEKLNKLDTLDRHSRFFVEGDTLVTTFAQDISRVFAVSDNEANNRLMEFLGQDAINNELAAKGVGPVRIAHQLGEHSYNPTTSPLLIYLNDSTTTPSKPIVNTAPQPLNLKNIRKGRGYYEEDSLYMGPFDFSLKNYYPLSTQHQVLKRVIFPEAYPKEQQFHISKEQRNFLLNAMQTLPREAGYDEAVYYDSYCKFFLFGDRHDRAPAHIHIYNKAGWAYGTLTDCAYIYDTDNGVEFLLSTTILVNPNGIFNDDDYAYEETGIPFLAELSRELYEKEKERLK